MGDTCEQKARELLVRLSGATYYTDPQRLSAGDVVELAQMFAAIERLKNELKETAKQRDEALEQSEHRKRVHIELCKCVLALQI